MFFISRYIYIYQKSFWNLPNDFHNWYLICCWNVCLYLSDCFSFCETIFKLPCFQYENIIKFTKLHWMKTLDVTWFSMRQNGTLYDNAEDRALSIYQINNTKHHILSWCLNHGALVHVLKITLVYSVLLYWCDRACALSGHSCGLLLRNFLWCAAFKPSQVTASHLTTDYLYISSTDNQLSYEMQWLERDEEAPVKWPLHWPLSDILVSSGLSSFVCNGETMPTLGYQLFDEVGWRTRLEDGFGEPNLIYYQIC